MTEKKSNYTKELADLRMKLKTDSMFSVELLGAISKVCRDNGVKLSNELISRLILATNDEVTTSVGVPVLPGGTNC